MDCFFMLLFRTRNQTCLTVAAIFQLVFQFDYPDDLHPKPDRRIFRVFLLVNRCVHILQMTIRHEFQHQVFQIHF
jgi:hypothetical protein